MCNKILSHLFASAVMVCLLSGCIFDDDVDVLNRANEREAKSLGIKDSLFCYDVNTNPHMDKWTVDVNGERYRCVVTVEGSRWVLENDLLNAL